MKLNQATPVTASEYSTHCMECVLELLTDSPSAALAWDKLSVEERLTLAEEKYLESIQELIAEYGDGAVDRLYRRAEAAVSQLMCDRLLAAPGASVGDILPGWDSPAEGVCISLHNKMIALKQGFRYSIQGLATRPVSKLTPSCV